MSETRPRDAHAAYKARLEGRSAEATRHKRHGTWVSHARLAVFGAGLVLAWFVWETKVVSLGWMAVPLAAFVSLMLLHDHLLSYQKRAERAVQFYEEGLARLEDRWSGTGDDGLRFLDESHAYARDLDLFGSGSLFELLCTTRTPWGARTLADWLRSPASLIEVRARQVAVAELRSRLDLREQLAVLDKGFSSQVDPQSLLRWASHPPVLRLGSMRLVAFVLAAVTAVGIIAWLASYTGRATALIFVSLEAAFAMWLRPGVRRVIFSADRPSREFALVSQLLLRLEDESFESPHLVELQRSLSANGIPASRQIARLGRIIELLDLRLNKMFTPVAAILLWGTQFAYALEAWRLDSGVAAERWLSALGELEALLALSTYSYEHPDDPFPQLTSAGPFFEGKGVGHPLIPEDRLVRNDLRLGGELRLLIVSGSNMSGKSTLLRTVGTNSVLALAGAPVRARHLQLSPLAIGASIRIVDSLQEGVSRFYAEIRRLRQIMDLTSGPLPLVFLMDEILHGTNSHDRRIGAEAVVRGLVERGAVGLITTHDLALSRVAESIAPAAANVHFEDHLEDGRVVFDYRLRSGVVRKSNALDLMRSIGLEV